MSLKPVALQVGTETEAVLAARFSMEGTYRVIVSGDGVTGTVVDGKSKAEQVKPDSTGQVPKRSANREGMAIRFKVDKHALPGVRDFRIAGPYGVSTIGQLVIVRDPVQMEKANNNTREKAEAIKLPATVCGTIEAIEDVDYFKFQALAGQSLMFSVRGLKLEDRIHDLQMHLDPIITIRDAAGTTVAVADNDVAGDPLLCHKFVRAGEYTLEVRDVRYKGDVNWVYCVEISDRPYLRTVFPLAVQAGQTASLDPVGWQFPSGKVNWTAPALPGLTHASLSLDGRAANPAGLLVTDSPVAAEKRSSSAEAQAIAIPSGVNGRLEQADEADAYAFQAKKGEGFTFETIARRLGSPLDSLLQIVDDKGAVVGEGDDLKEYRQMSSDAEIAEWTAPRDGTYRVLVRDLFQRGGPEFVYYLRVERARPQFSLFVDTDKTVLTPGTNAVLFVNAFRAHGFSGDISLAVENLPAGVTASCGRIAADHRDGCIILKAAPDAKLAVSDIRVVGTGEHSIVGGKMERLKAVATPLQETYVPGGGRGQWPVETHAVAIASPGDLRSVKLSTLDVTLKPGESKRIDVTIERAPGFADNVMLSPRFEHLSQVFGDTLPKGVEVDLKNSKTLLTGTETKGYITLKAAQTAEKCKRRQVSVMANLSLNFVMKSTFSSEPLYVSTAP